MPPKGEPVGSHCSFLERCKGRRVKDSGAMRLEMRAEKCCRLMLGTPAGEAGPPAQMAESRIQATIPRSTSGGPGKGESEAWARRNKAANIIAALHERKFFAEIKAHLERKAVDESEPSLTSNEVLRETPGELRRKSLLRRQREVRASLLEPSSELMQGSKIVSRQDFKDDSNIIQEVHIKVAGPSEQGPHSRGTWQPDVLPSSVVQEQHDLSEIKEHKEQLLQPQPAQHRAQSWDSGSATSELWQIHE